MLPYLNNHFFRESFLGRAFIPSLPGLRVHSVRTVRAFTAASSQIKPEIFPRVDLFASFTCVTEARDKMLIDCFQQGSSDENIYSPLEKVVIYRETAGSGPALKIRPA